MSNALKINFELYIKILIFKVSISTIIFYISLHVPNKGERRKKTIKEMCCNLTFILIHIKCFFQVSAAVATLVAKQLPKRINLQPEASIIYDTYSRSSQHIG